jgi:phosphoribosylanthranilate isomerase
MTRIRIKVCCIGSEAEASMAIAAGADAIGLVARMLTGPGVIEDAAIARIAASVPPMVSTFLLTSEAETDAVIAHARRCPTSTVQLVKRVAEDAWPALRAALPGVKLVQVVHVEDERAIEDARKAARLADAVLLDSGRPSLSELGGTGRVHDWAISRAIVQAAACPVILAGGLNAENVGRAMTEVRPYGLDLVRASAPTTGSIRPRSRRSWRRSPRSIDQGGVVH